MQQVSLGFDGNDLTAAVLEAEQILIANSGEDAFEEILKIILVKLYDEFLQQRGRAQPSLFSEAFQAPNTKDRLDALLLGATKEWAGVFDDAPGFKVASADLRHCMRPFLRVSLLAEEMLVLDATFEHLLGRAAKSSMGQYFTPRHVIDMCVEALQPGPDESVGDPACGSGGFLLHALRWQQSHWGRCSGRAFGLDLDQRAVRIAKIISQISVLGRIKVLRANSLDGRGWSNGDLGAEASDLFDSGCSTNDGPDLRAEDDGWQLLDRIRFDVVFANPPFAGTIADTEILRHYTLPFLAGRKAVANKLDRDLLFLERCLRMLRPGGRMAIVLPQGVLCNDSTAFLRQWLFRGCRVLGVIGLHPHTFIPHTGAKTSVLLLQKTEPAAGSYPIFFAVSERSGKDSSGQLIYTQRVAEGRTVQVVEHDLVKIAQAFREFGTSQMLDFSTQVPQGEKVYDREWQDGHVSIVASAEVAAINRLDAEFYRPDLMRLHNAISARSKGPISDHVASHVTRHKRRTNGKFLYIDISAVDPQLGLAVPSEVTDDDAPSRAQYRVKVGDVLVSTVRPNRNTVALVDRAHELPLVASNGFCILRAEDLTPEYLFAYCKTRYFRELLSRYAAASMYPAVKDKEVLDMPIFVADDKTVQQVSASIARAFSCMREARAIIESAIKSLEGAIEAEVS